MGLIREDSAIGKLLASRNKTPQTQQPVTEDAHEHVLESAGTYKKLKCECGQVFYEKIEEKQDEPQTS